MSKNVVDVEAIDILLIGNEKEIAEGIRLIHANFRNKIFGIISKKALGAKYNDWEDIYQDVILSILEAATTRKYNPDAQKLESFICIIACRRAADWGRKRRRIKEEHNTDLLVESTKEIISGSKYNDMWKKALAEEKRGLILQAIRNLIPKLKHRQRQVAEIIVDNFPESLDSSSIKSQILNRYEEDVTTVAVRRARQAVCMKVKEALSIAGYGDYVDD